MNALEIKQTFENKENVLYEDEVGIVALPLKPCTKGHVIVIPKTQYKTIEEIPDKELEHLFYIASFSATALFETLGMQGTNIIADTGNEYVKENLFVINVIARKENDGLNFMWQPKKLDEATMNDAQKAIKNKADLIAYEEEEKKKKEKAEEEKEKPAELKEEKEKVEEIKPKTTEEGKVEDYRIKQLKRIP